MANRQMVGTKVTTAATTHVANVAATLAGSLLVLFAYNSGSFDISGVTDNQGNTWQRAYTPGLIYFQIWYAPNAAAGVTQVTITYAGSAKSKSIFLERDDATPSPLDQMKVETSQGGVTSFSTGNAPATTQARTVGIGCHSTFTNDTSTFSPSGGWVAVSGSGITNGSVADAGEMIYMQTQDFSSTGAYASTGTSDTSDNIKSSLLLFDLAAAAAPPSYPMRSDNWF
jgi:hypothetical protein